MHLKKDNLILVGTSHVAKESVQEIAKMFETYDVQIAAVELDQIRLHQLFQENKKGGFPFRVIGLRAALFALIAGWLQRKIGKIVNIDPGSDMKQAAILAGKKKIPLVCIDQDIRITLRKLNKELNFGLGWKAFKDAVYGLFFPKRMQKKMGLDQLDLKRVPSHELIEKMMLVMKNEYPGLYKILVHERNIYMTNQIKAIQEQFPDKLVLVAVGAGHLSGINELLNSEHHINVSTEWESDVSYTDTTVTNTSKKSRRVAHHD